MNMRIAVGAWVIGTAVLLGACGGNESPVRVPNGGAAGSSSREADGAGDVVGYWEAEKTSSGGLSSVLRFQAGGAAQSAKVVRLDGRYTVDGALLSVDLLQTDATLQARWALRADGELDLWIEQVTNVDEPPERRILSRVGTAVGADVPFVGVYTWTHPRTGAVGYERYSHGGKFEFRVPLSPAANEGTWSRDGDTVTVRWSGPSRTVEATFEYRAETQQLVGEDSGLVLSRAGADLWYPFVR